MGPRRRAAPYLLLLLAVPGPAAADDRRAPHGPLEAREEWLLALPVLNLPAESADVLERGRTEVRLDGDWGNDFGWKPSTTDVGAPPQKPGDPVFFMVDGEHRSAGLRVRRGLGAGWDAGVRVGVRWRGPGVLDSVIDPFHDLFGFPNAGRPFFPQNVLRVEGDLAGGGRRLAWAGQEGLGLAAPEIQVRRSLRHADARVRPAIALRATLPLGTGEFGESAGAAGLQLLVRARLSRAFSSHSGVGVVALGDDEIEGVPYVRTRTHAFGGLEWRFADAWGVVAQGEIASRLVSQELAGHPALHLYLRMGMRWDVAPRWRVEGSFVEGLASLDGTTDFGVAAAVSREF